MQSVDPDQTPRSAASDQGLHCLPMSLLWDASLKWFEYRYKYFPGTPIKSNKTRVIFIKPLYIKMIYPYAFWFTVQ